MGHIQGWCGVCHEGVGWGCYAGVGCVGCVMQGGGVGDEEIGWVMKGWIGLCKIS